MKKILLAVLVIYSVIYVGLHLRLHGASFLYSYLSIGILGGSYNYLSATGKKTLWGILGFLTGIFGVLTFIITSAVLKRKRF